MTTEQKATIDRLIRKKMVRDFIMNTRAWCEQHHRSSLGDITNSYNEAVYSGANHFIREIGRVDMEAMRYMLESIEGRNP